MFFHHIICVCQEAEVSEAGELSELSEAAGAFVHVDLKANLLYEWQQVDQYWHDTKKRIVERNAARERKKDVMFTDPRKKRN